MLRPSPNHGTQRLPNDDDDDECKITVLKSYTVIILTSECQFNLIMINLYLFIYI